MAKEKIKKPFYKKWWVWVIVVIIAIGMASGGDDDVSEPTLAEPNKTVENKDDQNDVSENMREDEGESEEPEEENIEFYIGDKVEMGDYVLQVTEVEKSQGNDFDKPADGNEYIIVNVLIENNGDKEISYNPFNFKMKNSNGQIEDIGFITIDSDTALSSGELAAGGHVTGTLSFEQPKDDNGLQLFFEPSFWDTDRIVVNLQ